jgi:hypothetical protein
MELFADNIKIPFGGALTMKLYNPLFNDISGHSLPVSFNGKIPSVKKAFGFPSRPEAEVKSSITGRIKTPVFDLAGSWKVNKASDDNIEATFRSSSGDFYSAIKEKKLHEIDFGEPKSLGADFWDPLPKAMDTYYPESEFAAFCAWLENAQTANEFVPMKLINPVWLDENGDPFFSSIDPYGDPFYSNGGERNIGIYLFAGTVIEYLFSEHGYKIEDNIFVSDPDLSRLVIFNTYNASAPVYSDEWHSNLVDYSKLVPHISCSTFLKALRNRFNVGFFINESSKSVKIKSFKQVLSEQIGTNIRCGKLSVEDAKISGIKFPFSAPDAYASHATESMSELSGATEVNKYRDILPDTRTNGDLFFVKSERTYYRIKYTPPDTYEAVKLCTDDIQYSSGNAAEEVEQLSSIPAMYTHTITEEFEYGSPPETYTTEVDYLLPRCDLVSNWAVSPFTEFPLMFLFARGIVNCYTVPAEGAPVFKYPFGSNDLYDASANTITGTMTLKWDGDYGVIEKLWLDRIAWELGIKKLVKTDVLSDDLYKLIDFSRPVRIGNNNYLVNVLEIQMTNKTTRLNDIELYRL